MTDSRRLVVVPTYNEAQNIAWIIKRLRVLVPSLDVLVVDDGSPDGTGDIAEERARADGQVQVLHRVAKRGLGAAYLAGFAWGLARDYDVLIEMDADGSHQPEQLPQLLDALPRADLVLGSRWVEGGSVVNWPLHRKALSRGGNLYVRMALGLPLHDATGGFRVFRRSTLEGIDLRSVTSEGYCFQIDLARRALAAGYRVVEVPITFVEREYGESKMSGAIVRESLVKVTRWGFEHRADQVRSALDGRREVIR